MFNRDIKTIGKHIANAKREELQNISVVAKFATTASDGKSYQVEHYNLDMILSVGYRDTVLRTAPAKERQLFTLAGLAEPEFKNMESGFYVKVKAPPITPPIVTSMSLNDKILLLLKDNPNLSRTDIATRLSISPNTAKEYLAKLSTEGKIVRKGSNRAGYWEVRS